MHKIKVNEFFWLKEDGQFKAVGVMNEKPFTSVTEDYKGKKIFKVLEDGKKKSIKDSCFNRGERQSLARFLRRVMDAEIDMDGKRIENNEKPEVVEASERKTNSLFEKMNILNLSFEEEE